MAHRAQTPTPLHFSAHVLAMSLQAARSSQSSLCCSPLALAPPKFFPPSSRVPPSVCSCTQSRAARRAQVRAAAALGQSRTHFFGETVAWTPGQQRGNGQAEMMHTSQPGFDFMDRDEGSVRRRNITCSYILDDVPHLAEFLPTLKTYTNPLSSNPAYAFVENSFVERDDIVMQMALTKMHSGGALPCFRRSGPREQIYFNPPEVKAVIVTCGGLCPGLNTVIRELVWGLWFQYGVRHIYGIDGGYKGFYSRNWIELDPKKVNDIHKRGGTFLGTSRGGHDTEKIVNAIQDRGANQVYIIGGDGTQRGAARIYEECRQRGLAVSIAGIPKTIDNDIPIIDKSFGFDTAVEEAQRAINAAHVEAESTHQCVGIVKLMGRDCGQIAMHATLASRDVDCCLTPEAPFHLEGDGGLLQFIERRLRENDHCVIVVAEGAGQELIKAEMDKLPQDQQDASGNRALLDIGLWLSERIKAYFSKVNHEVQLKYIDPTYMIRAIPANASDNIYCTLLAHSAIHGAMAGFTGFVAGPVNGRHSYMPLHRITLNSNKVSLTDRMWARLLASTSQPTFLRFNKTTKAVPNGAVSSAITATHNGPPGALAPLPGAPLAPNVTNGTNGTPQGLDLGEDGADGAGSVHGASKSALSSSGGSSAARPVMPPGARK